MLRPFAHPVAYCCLLLRKVWNRSKAACKRTQHCWPTTTNIVGCYMFRPFAHPVACCWMLLRVVAQIFKPVKLFRQQLPTFLLFRDRRSVAQQCWIRLHSSSNIFGATYAHYAWITKNRMGSCKELWVVSFPRCTAGPKLVWICCIRLHTTANTHATTPNIVGVVAPVCTQPNF